MDSTSLFTSALGLQDLWKVAEIRFELDQGAIHSDLACDAKRQGCPACAAADQAIHDRSRRTWHHLHFFQFKAFLNAALPRVKCNHCGKVIQAELPWTRRGIGTAEGRKADIFGTFKDDFVSRNGQPEAIGFITMDVSKSSQAGVRKQAPRAEICFDAFHISQQIHDPVDEVRHTEVKLGAFLNGSLWGLLKFPEDWPWDQINDIHWLQCLAPKTARAWRMTQRYKQIHLICRAGADPALLYQSRVLWTKRNHLESFSRLSKTLGSRGINR